MADIGPYRIVSPMGEGAQALSYRAVHVHLEREVFLKVLSAGGPNWPERRGRFEREAKALARIDHPAVVKVWDFGDTGDRLYIASEFVPGRDLAQRIHEGPLSWDELTPMTLTLLDGLGALHQAGIIHRDIKPSNIMLSDTGPKLADLGLARLLQSPSATQSDTLVGTPAYLDPETLRGGVADVRADLFSLGATLYEALTGRRAFPGETFAEVVKALLEADPTQSLPPDSPPEARRFLAALLEKDPSRRPHDAAEARALLRASIAAPPPSRRRSTRRGLAYGGLSVLCVLAVLAVLRAPRHQESPAPVTPGPVIGSRLSPMSLGEPSAAAPEDALDAAVSSTGAPVPGTALPSPEAVQEPTAPSALRGDPREAPAAEAPALLWISTSPWAEVWIQGVVQDTTPLTGALALPPGRHEITLKHLAFPEIRAVVELRAGIEESLFVSLADSLGFLQVYSDPWARVRVDGVPVGTTPLAEPIALRPGAYEITAENPFFPVRVERVTMDPGDTVSLGVDLRRTPER